MFKFKKEDKKEVSKGRSDSKAGFSGIGMGSGSGSALQLQRSGSEASVFVPKETFNTIFIEDLGMTEKFNQNQPASCPDNPIYRSVWVMKLLHGVISKGAFVSPSLFIPKEIWYQYDIEIEALELKLVAVETCSELLKGLGTKLPNQQDEEVLAKELSAINAELEAIAERLAARVSCVKPLKPATPSKDTATKKDKKKLPKSQKTKTIVAGIVEKYDRKQNQSIDSYRFQLEALLGNSGRILENWLRYTDRMKGGAKELMRKINGFVEYALLPFILEDFTVLFCGQLEKLEKTFTTVINK